MASPVPTMSTKGWLTEPHEKGQQLMAWFMMSRPTQSMTFVGNVSSMSELVVKYGKSPGALCDHTKIVLDQYFGRYFDAVDTEVKEIPMPGETAQHGRYQIQITVTAVEGQQRINVMEGAEIGDNSFTRVRNLINNGGVQ